MSKGIKYIPSIEEVIVIHEKTVDISGGGDKSILNLHSLQAALELMQNDDYYPSFETKLSHLFYVANKSHCFQDGNKRIAIALGMRFLLDNGYVFIVQKFAERMESISYQVAAGRINKSLLGKIIESILKEDDYSEELKLQILNAIQAD